ncbi:hypothetical protein [Winogradskyella ursingii]|uniref:hypothetical protein n=1 Tax=Winogradskyella ursingii TaxID=2686079 RepID=UPI0015CEC88A|nr:hypothetical protein [Winogradskyella ursingii]
MKLMTTIFFSFLIIQQGCNSEKRYTREFSMEDSTIIESTILDFSKNSTLYQTSNLFSVNKEQILKSVKTDNPKNKNYSLINGLPYQNLIQVTITANPSTESKFDASQIGDKSKLIPSRYVERDGKLFVWIDEDYPLTEKTYQILKKYNVVQNDRNSEQAEIAQPENQYYYFCPNNINKFLRLELDQNINTLNDPILDCINN